MGGRIQGRPAGPSLCAAMLASLVVSGAAQAGSGAIEIFPPPDFVIEHAPVTPEQAAFPATGGLRILLLDTQYDATGDEPAFYMRQVVAATGVAGLAGASQVVAQYDPAFQRFELNHVRIIRGGVAEDRRDRAQLDVLRREEALEQQMITGVLTASLRLDDVRVGDVVDVAYTIYGAQPAFTGRDARSVMLGTPVAVERFALRARWPAGARWVVHGDGPPVTETREHGTVMLEVAPQAMDALEFEEYAPAWEPMVPYLEAASFADWADVADWGRELYEVTPDPAVTAIAESIAAEHADAAEQVVAALRFVQQDVRYLAITLGVGGYVPAAPGETLRSRAGDCKAKTLLFLALMDALDIEATAAFVSTTAGPSLPDHVPSPIAFDHVIARVKLDGATYWLDPTTVFQGGTLDVLIQPWFGYALPLDRHSGELVAMTRRDLTEPDIVMRETYDLSGGTSRPAHVHVEVVATGAYADFQRALSGVYGNSAIEDTLVERYRKRYGEAALSGESRYDDDLDANVFRRVHEVTLDDPFTTESRNARRHWFEVEAYITAPVLASKAKERVWPVSVLGPAHHRHEIVLELPDVVGGWKLPAEDDAIENAAFRFGRRAVLSGLTYTLDFELETLTDSIPPDMLDAVIEDQERMLELLEGSIWITDGARERLPDLELPPLDIEVTPATP